MKNEKEYLFFHYWSYRCRSRDTLVDGNIAFTLRAKHHMLFNELRAVVDELRNEDIIPDSDNVGYLVDLDVGSKDEWNLALAFDLYPCIEICYTQHDKAKWEWKRVTA
jgi:hypothetical protein